MKLFFQQLLVCSIVFPVPGIAFSAAQKEHNDILLLTIVATETEKLSSIYKHKSLSKQFKSLSIISSNDCSNLKSGLVLYVTAKTLDKSVSKKSLQEAKALVADSYQRECKVKPGSLLDNGYSFIHNSIFMLPEDTISWSFDDVKSEVVVLDENISFLIERKFNGDLNNEVEGRQSTVNIIKPDSNIPQLILNQCWDFEYPSVNNNLLVFQCMTGMAANHFIHTVYAYNLKNQAIVFKKEYCQQAKIKSKNLINCMKESVDANGELRLLLSEFEIESN